MRQDTPQAMGPVNTALRQVAESQPLSEVVTESGCGHGVNHLIPGFGKSRLIGIIRAEVEMWSVPPYGSR